MEGGGSAGFFFFFEFAIFEGIKNACFEAAEGEVEGVFLDLACLEGEARRIAFLGEFFDFGPSWVGKAEEGANFVKSLADGVIDGCS